MSSETTRVYELGFLLVPTTPEGEVEAEVSALTALITTHEGKVLSQGTPEFIDLGYKMEKNVAGKKLKWSQGYFGWTKFELPSEAMEPLKKSLDGLSSMIRYILIKTNVENTVVFKKPKVEPKRGGPDESEIVIEEADLAALDAQDAASDHEKLPDLTADLAQDVTASPEA